MPDNNDSQPDDSVSSTILAIVESIEVCTLFDFGSFVSIVSEDFRNSHSALKKRPMTPSSLPTRSVNGQRLPPGHLRQVNNWDQTWKAGMATGLLSYQRCLPASHSWF